MFLTFNLQTNQSLFRTFDLFFQKKHCPLVWHNSCRKDTGEHLFVRKNWTLWEQTERFEKKNFPDLPNLWISNSKHPIPNSDSVCPGIFESYVTSYDTANVAGTLLHGVET